MKATLQILIAQIRDQIARDELPAALSALRGLLENTPQLNEILQQSGRLQNIWQQVRTGTILQEDANLEQNRIRYGVLELLTELEQASLPATALGDLLAALEQESTRPELREELEKAMSIVNSKNVVADSNITAGGNVQVGDNTTQNAEKIYNFENIEEANFVENHYHHSSPKTPQQLTTATAAVPAGFIGREKELSEIRRRLRSGSGALALVNAEGGMGKTTLAAAYWQRFSQEYQHLAWLFCENGILSAMRSLLPDALDLREAMNEVADQPQRQIQLIIQRMANLPKDCLLVLDNANTPEHISEFERHCAGLGWHVLITSRCSKVLTERDAEFPITSLPPEEAKRLFRSYCDEKTAAFEALLERFLQAVGYNTLCIELFSKTLREGADWGLDFKSLLQKLETNGLKLGAHSFEIRTHWGQTLQTQAANSDQVIEALYNTSSLAPEESELLAQICLLPAESHPPLVLGTLLAPNDKPGLKRRLDQLAQKGWLSANNNSYRVSPVVQKILLDKYAGQLWDLGAVIVERLEVIFETEGTHSKNIATAGPFAELVFGLVDNLVVANEELANLYAGLWVYHNASGNLAKALGTADRMKVLCKSSGDRYNLNRAYELLGETHRALGNLNQALELFEMETKLLEGIHEASPLNEDFKNNLAVSYSKLGDTHSALGNLIQALTFFEKANQTIRELHETSPEKKDFKNGLSISFERLGETHRALGNLIQALTFFEKANQTIRELQEAFPQNVEFKNSWAISYQYLGITHSALGNLPQALTFFEQFNNLQNELHLAFPDNVEFKNGLAVSFIQLGYFFEQKMQKSEKAQEHYQASRVLLEELVASFPDYVKFKEHLDWVKGKLKD